MNPLIFLKLFTHWQMILISGLILILLPLVFYISTLKRRPKKLKPPSPSTEKKAPESSEEKAE